MSISPITSIPPTHQPAVQPASTKVDRPHDNDADDGVKAAASNKLVDVKA